LGCELVIRHGQVGEEIHALAEIVIRAERLMGEMLRETVRHEGGRPKRKLLK